MLLAIIPPLAPTWRLTLDGRDLAPAMAPRLVSLSLQDKRGLEADELEIRLSDHDGLLAIPSRGAILSLALGYAGDLLDRGSYTVSEVEHSGTPDALVIRARSADLRAGPWLQKRTQSWHDSTVGAIVREIAGRQSLQAIVASDLAGIAAEHWDQSQESDAALLTRLADRYDAVATVKAGRLLFAPLGRGLSASGQPLPEIRLTRRDGDRHRWTLAERDAYTGVVAEWKDTRAAERKEAVAGSGDNPKRLRGTYATEADALRAATSEFGRIRRGKAEFEFDLSVGRADLAPETPVYLSGFKPEIDATRWVTVQADHRIDDSGFSTRVRFEAATE